MCVPGNALASTVSSSRRRQPFVSLFGSTGPMAHQRRPHRQAYGADSRSDRGRLVQAHARLSDALGIVPFAAVMGGRGRHAGSGLEPFVILRPACAIACDRLDPICRRKTSLMTSHRQAILPTPVFHGGSLLDAHGVGAEERLRVAPYWATSLHLSDDVHGRKIRTATVRSGAYHSGFSVSASHFESNPPALPGRQILRIFDATPYLLITKALVISILHRNTTATDPRPCARPRRNSCWSRFMTDWRFSPHAAVNVQAAGPTTSRRDQLCRYRRTARGHDLFAGRTRAT